MLYVEPLLTPAQRLQSRIWLDLSSAEWHFMYLTLRHFALYRAIYFAMYCIRFEGFVINVTVVKENYIPHIFFCPFFFDFNGKCHHVKERFKGEMRKTGKHNMSSYHYGCYEQTWVKNQ